MVDYIWYFLFYSFMGWIVEVGVCAILRKQFRNRGFLSAPLILSYGIAFCILIVVLPNLPGKILTWVLLAFMSCNALLTMAAMLRYGAREIYQEPANRFEAFLDER